MRPSSTENCTNEAPNGGASLTTRFWRSATGLPRTVRGLSHGGARRNDWPSEAGKRGIPDNQAQGHPDNPARERATHLIASARGQECVWKAGQDFGEGVNWLTPMRPPFVHTFRKRVRV